MLLIITSIRIYEFNLQRGVSCKNGIVWLDDGRGNLRRRINCKFKLRFLSIIDGKSFHQERSESRARSAAKRMKDQESLQARAAIGQLSYAVKCGVDDFFADGVVSSCIIVRRVLLARDQLLWVKQLAVSAVSNFIDDGRLQIDENRARDVLSRARFGKEGVE